MDVVVSRLYNNPLKGLHLISDQGQRVISRSSVSYCVMMFLNDARVDGI